MADELDTLRVGSTDAFDSAWQSRHEARYNHWTRGRPSNQIQFAFRSHWELFREIIGEREPGRVLEVGCGRGSISSYFADAGWDTLLLDYSESVLHVARDIFRTNGHSASYARGDAMALPVADGAVDVVVSIGLLEHFEAPGLVLEEQARVLAPGGVMLVYVVPEYTRNIQAPFRWVNRLLAAAVQLRGGEDTARSKESLYRSDDGSPTYLETLRRLPLEGLEAHGVYPLPMISHSPEFPFSLMAPPLEWALTRAFAVTMAIRRRMYRRNPWLCREGLGQAFLLVGRKR